MALGTIANWLQLPNFQQAAEAGARIGLQQKTAAEEAALARANLEEQSKLKREQMAQAAAEAAGKLGLGYASLGAENKKHEDANEMAKAVLALRGNRNADLNEQAGERHQLGVDRLTALEENRDVVNGIRQGAQDSLNEHRAEAVALRGTGRVGGGSTAPTAKSFMVKVPVPANPETGEAATTISLPSTHWAAKSYLKEHGIGDAPPDMYAPENASQSGETLPIPDPNAQAAQALKPRNLIYMGGKTDNPIFDPPTMEPETLPAPDGVTVAPPIAKSGNKRFKYDPVTGKFNPVE